MGIIYFGRVLMCIVYIVFVYWSINVLGGLGEHNGQLQILLWIHVGLKLLFIKLQDEGCGFFAARFILEALLIWFFAPAMYGYAIIFVVLFPLGFAWSNLVTASSLATGHGPVEIHNALDKAISDRNHYD